LTSPPFHPGDFVWCAFPEHEAPDRPSRGLHIAYTLAVTGAFSATVISLSATPADPQAQSVVAYTTSQPRPHAGNRPGMVSFSAEEAATFGQQRPFVLHLWRVAYLPITPV
jgi:hypothetical protein